MRASQFKARRKSLKTTQKKAASALELKSRIIQYYEKASEMEKRSQFPKPSRLLAEP